MSGRFHRAMTATSWVLVVVAPLLQFTGIFSLLGLFTLPMAAGAAIVLLARPDWMRGWAIMLCAAAVAPLLTTWLNKDGPGRICSSLPSDPAGSCIDQLSPWPWLAVAALSLGAAGVLLLLGNRRANAKSRSSASAG
jgi:hypothetical protein